MQHAIVVPGLLAGLLLGIAFIAIGLLAGDMSYTAQELLGLLAIAIAVAAAQRAAIRRHPLGAQANYPARYFAGMLAGAVTALAYGVIAWLHFSVIDPGHLDRFYAAYLERARAGGETAAQREQLVAAAERMQAFILDPFSQAMVQFGTALMLALLTGIAAAWLVKPASYNNPS